MNQETRQIIYNQLEILKRLNPDSAAEYERQQHIISSGFTSRYSQVLFVDKDALSADVQTEVYQTLEMFRVLNDTLNRGWTPKNPSDAKFRGYDGNNDDGYYEFARHLLQEENLFEESSPMKNSHSSGTIAKYRRMVARWKGANNAYVLSDAEADAIVAA